MVDRDLFNPLKIFYSFELLKLKKLHELMFLPVTKAYQIRESKNSKAPFHCSGRRHVFLELLVYSSQSKICQKEIRIKWFCILLILFWGLFFTSNAFYYVWSFISIVQCSIFYFKNCIREYLRSVFLACRQFGSNNFL